MEQEDAKTRRFWDCSEAVIGARIEVHRLLPIHNAQLLSRLRLTKPQTGLLENFLRPSSRMA
jgi:hypothetical protein